MMRARRLRCLTYVSLLMLLAMFTLPTGALSAAGELPHHSASCAATSTARAGNLKDRATATALWHVRARRARSPCGRSAPFPTRASCRQARLSDAKGARMDTTAQAPASNSHTPASAAARTRGSSGHMHSSRRQPSIGPKVADHLPLVALASGAGGSPFQALPGLVPRPFGLVDLFEPAATVTNSGRADWHTRGTRSHLGEIFGSTMRSREHRRILVMMGSGVRVPASACSGRGSRCKCECSDSPARDDSTIIHRVRVMGSGTRSRHH